MRRAPAGLEAGRAPVRVVAVAASTIASLCGGDTEVLLDLRHRSRVRVEEVGVDLVPAAELVDLEQLLRLGVDGLVDEVGQDAAVALRRVDLLRLGGLEEVQEGLR